MNVCALISSQEVLRGELSKCGALSQTVSFSSNEAETHYLNYSPLPRTHFPSPESVIMGATPGNVRLRARGLIFY